MIYLGKYLPIEAPHHGFNSRSIQRTNKSHKRSRLPCLSGLGDMPTARWRERLLARMGTIASPPIHQFHKR
ncbi:hypothetical protein [Microseira wollei]|uniref:hypothetical protein n=1 Tax=Microseira wollei TaxID=467598 RepID=UPI001CFD710F|nr:hypothetical protein [Microseira wollei]